MEHYFFAKKIVKRNTLYYNVFQDNLENTDKEEYSGKGNSNIQSKGWRR